MSPVRVLVADDQPAMLEILAEMVRAGEDVELVATAQDATQAVERYLNRRVGLDLAENLASETFVVAFRRRAGYDWGREDARPWLFGVATNLVRRYRRTERRKRVGQPSLHPSRTTRV